ncbi:hypothetical protein B566_EDAN016846 [Ephemera danica]|nr:hypothetical protein B566_EDAN016846 [Ephemera danica]
MALKMSFKTMNGQKCTLFFLVVLYCLVHVICSGDKCDESQCVNGICENGTCQCFDGWQGSNCQFCGGKIRLSDPAGYIFDGQGNYSVNSKCSWLVSSDAPNTSIHLHLEEFATECGWDNFDARFNCSGYGVCNDGVCTCDAKYTGDACMNIPICPRNCSGEDCNQRADLGYWDVLQTELLPEGSASHGVVVWRDSLYVVGGESYKRAKPLYVYNFTENVWQPKHIPEHMKPQTRYGHSADKIYMYGGVDESGTITSELWTYDLSTNGWENINVHAESCNTGLSLSPVMCDTNEWSVVITRGFPVKGGYGHSSVWDAANQKIYVYGGYVSQDFSNSNNLYSAIRIQGLVVSRGLMLVFGGNTHTTNNDAKCYSSDFLAYDIACDSWTTLDTPVLTTADLSRFGHSAVMFNDSMYIYGGFDGQLLSDLLRCTPGRCNSFDESRCKTLKPGIKCVWNDKKERCEEAHQDLRLEAGQCHGFINQNRAELCAMLDNCIACVQTSHDCVWCKRENGSSCSHVECKDSALHAKIQHYRLCLCLNSVKLMTPFHVINYTLVKFVTIMLIVAGILMILGAKLLTMPVGFHVNELIVKPIAHSSHRAKIVANKIASGQSDECNFYASCAECQENPACGWCDDGTGTGVGRCLKGGNKNPENSEFCHTDSWFFTNCPNCQCNGHSSCVNGSKQCSQPCNNLTQGAHCNKCIPGYYGNPANGGRCVSCDCNNKATQCNPATGKCFCTTKGMVGDRCERCDEMRRYFSDLTHKGSCFSPSKFNVTVRPTADSPAKVLLVAQNCSEFNHRFSKSEYKFGASEDNVEQTTFYIHVYDFHSPVMIRVSFTQYKPRSTIVSTFFNLYYQLWGEGHS